MNAEMRIATQPRDRPVLDSVQVGDMLSKLGKVRVGDVAPKPGLETSLARFLAIFALLAGSLLFGDRAAAADASDETWAVHGQATFVLQANGAFRSPYEGPNSLNPRGQAKETFDATLYAGLQPWRGGEIWINPEIDQGFGLSDTLGVAGFPSGEAYKVGKSSPYAKLPRWFARQTIDLGGEKQRVDPDLNQLGGHQTANRLVLTLGKFSIVDIFDTNSQAHDPRSDFLNWAIIDTGTFDYAANAWGYTYGAAAELYWDRWAIRAGVFDLSKVPNGIDLDPTFHQNELVGEIEERHSIAGQPGKAKITVFANRGRMGRYADAIALAEATGQPADITAVRRYRSRLGFGFNLEQQIAKDWSLFMKGGIADGNIEPYEFADIDRTIASGFAVKGAQWGRPDDTLAVAAVLNGISRIHQEFLNAGGLGILIGDGRLPHPGPEGIIETYYDFTVAKPLHVTLDYQFVNNPGYNRERGPVSIGALRLHAQF